MCVPDSPFSSLHVFIVLVLDGSASRILSSFCANNTLNTMRCDCIWLSLQWDGWLDLCIIVAGTGSVFMWHKQEEAQLHMFLCMVGLLHSCGHYSIRSGCFSCCWCMVLVQCHVWLPWWVDYAGTLQIKRLEFRIHYSYILSVQVVLMMNENVGVWFVDSVEFSTIKIIYLIRVIRK